MSFSPVFHTSNILSCHLKPIKELSDHKGLVQEQAPPVPFLFQKGIKGPRHLLRSSPGKLQPVGRGKLSSEISSQKGELSIYS